MFLLAMSAMINDAHAKLTWGRGRVYDQQVASMFAALAAGGGALRCVEVTRREESLGRPKALNTVDMLKACSSRLGMGPKHAMVRRLCVCMCVRLFVCAA